MRSAASHTVPLLEPEPVVASIDAAGWDPKSKTWSLVIRTNGKHWNDEELCAAIAAVCSNEAKERP